MVTYNLRFFLCRFGIDGSLEEVNKWKKVFEYEVSMECSHGNNTIPVTVWEALHVHTITLTATTDSIHDNTINV